MYVVQCIFQKIEFYFQVCYLTDFADMKHTLYNFLKKMKLSSSYFSKKHFIKVNSLHLFLLSNQKHPLYYHTFQIAISQVSRIIQLDLHSLLLLLASFLKFSGSHFESIMVNSQRLRNDTCYFYLGKIICFKIKMSLPIDYLS